MARLGFCYSTVHGDKTKRIWQIKNNFCKRQLPVVVFLPKFGYEDHSFYDYYIGREENIFLTVKHQFQDISLLVIDQAHLLSEVQIDQLLQVVLQYDIAVLCFGLRTDFRTNGFIGARRLLELSQVLIKIPTFCKCGREALFSVRKQSGKITFQGEKIVNNKDISYEALCPKCYYRKVIQYKKLKEQGRLDFI